MLTAPKDIPALLARLSRGEDLSLAECQQVAESAYKDEDGDDVSALVDRVDAIRFTAYFRRNSEANPDAIAKRLRAEADLVERRCDYLRRLAKQVEDMRALAVEEMHRVREESATATTNGGATAP